MGILKNYKNELLTARFSLVENDRIHVGDDVFMRFGDRKQYAIDWHTGDYIGKTLEFTLDELEQA